MFNIENRTHAFRSKKKHKAFINGLDSSLSQNDTQSFKEQFPEYTQPPSFDQLNKLNLKPEDFLKMDLKQYVVDFLGMELVEDTPIYSNEAILPISMFHRLS